MSGNLDVTCTALEIWLRLMGRMLTTKGPENIPAVTVGMDVLYIGTLHFMSWCRSGIFACFNVFSKEKLQPMRKDTRSLLQMCSMDWQVSDNSPSRYMLYKGTSYRISAPVHVKFGAYWPGSMTSNSGQGFGLRWQNNKKSKERDFGNITTLACTYPSANPDVTLLILPDLIARRMSVGIPCVGEVSLMAVSPTPVLGHMVWGVYRPVNLGKVAKAV